MALYVVAASAWIVLSDRVMGLLLDPHTMTRFATAKGLAFVVLSAGLFGMVIARLPDRGEMPAAAGRAGAGIALSVYLARLILISILPIFLLATVLGVVLVIGTRAEQDVRAADLAHEVAADIDRDLTARVATLNMLAGSPLLDDRATWPQFYELAQSFQRNFGSHIVVSDTGDPMRMLINTREPLGTALPLMPRPQGHAAAPMALETGRPAVGDSFLGPVAKTPLVAVAAPALRGGQVRHIVLTTLETRSFQPRLLQLALPPGWGISLRDGRGEVIARRRPAVMDGNDLERIEAEGGIVTFTAPLAAASWTAAVEIPQGVRDGAALTAATTLGLGLLLMGGASLLGGTLASRTLSRQVAALTEAVAGPPPSIQELAQARHKLDEASRLARENQDRYVRLFANVPLALGFVSAQGQVIARNRQFELLFGYTADDLATIDDWWRLACPDPEYRAGVQTAWNAAVSRSVVEHRDATAQEFWITRRDGRELLVQVSGLAVADGMLASFVDVTERRRAEDVLRESEAKYRLLAENAADCIVWTAPDHRIQYISPACLAVFGHPVEAFLADPDLLTAIIHPDDAARYGAHLDCGCASPLDEMEFRVVFPDGSEHWVAHRCWPVRDADGRCIGRHAINRDITAIWRESEERHRLSTALRRAGLPILMADAARRVTFANQAFLDLFGYGAEEIQGIALRSLVPADSDCQTVHETICRTVAERDIWSGELVRLARDGDGLPVFCTVSALRDLGGALTGFVVSYIDLRPLKAQQQALSDSQARYQIILDHAADAVFVADGDGRYLYVNHRAGELLGYDPGELSRMVIADITAPEGAAHSAATFQDLRRDGHLFTELLLLRKDGARVPVELNAILLPDGSFYGACRDISERRRAEKQLRDLSEAIAQTPLSVVITGLDGRIEYVNAAFSAATGYGRDEVLGRSPRLLSSGTTPCETYQAMWATLGEGRSWKGEFVNRRKDGSLYTDLAIIAPVRQAGGEIAGYVSIQEDISEKKRLDDELNRHRRRLELLVEEKARNAEVLRRTVDRLTIANSELERFAVVAAHDLREPARTVSMYAQVLERHRGGRMDDEEREYLHYLQIGAQRIYDLIGGLLAYSRVPAEAGIAVPVSAARACAAAVDNLAALIHEAGADIVVAPLPMVMGDEMQVLQLFQHLIGNALKFRDADRTPRVEVAARRDGGRWLFSVKDNGIGFAAGEQDVFELFRQLSPGRALGGVGTGLAICKRIVQRQGGDIRAESTPGQGSTFYFTLPAAP